MARRISSALRDFDRAKRRHRPPADSLRDNGRFVLTELLLANDLEAILQHVYDQAQGGRKPDDVGYVTSHAVVVAGLSLIACDHGLRMYLLDKDKSATELPPRPIEGTQYLERNNRVIFKMEPGAWSLIKVMEDDTHFAPTPQSASLKA